MSNKMLNKNIAIGVLGLGYFGRPRWVQFAKKNKKIIEA